MADKIKILFLAANPEDEVTHAQIGNEFREIGRLVEKGPMRNRLELVLVWALTPGDLQQALLRYQPHIVHFSGHNSPVSGIQLEDKSRNRKPVSPKALSYLFGIFKDQIRVVVLNGCYDKDQAQALAETIDFTIGLSTSIEYKDAIIFASQFYLSLAFGRSVEEAFELAVNQLEIEGSDLTHLPRLLVRRGANEAECRFVEHARRRPHRHVEPKSEPIARSPNMHKFSIGDFVKHKNSDFHIFRVLFELTTVPPGGPSLYHCISLSDPENKLYNYSEDDLYKVELSKEEIQQMADEIPFSEAPDHFKAGKYRISPIFATRSFKRRPKSCFMLMPFSQKWSDRVFKRIKEILNGLGYEVYRADDLYGHDVLEDIWTAINESEIIIADTTAKNPNVFYEIGIAHTIGKKVILLSQNEKDIPFDFKRYRHIIYQDNVDGFELLRTELPKYLE